LLYYAFKSTEDINGLRAQTKNEKFLILAESYMEKSAYAENYADTKAFFDKSISDSTKSILL